MQEIKLGIVCVYLLDPADGQLLDIHLGFIRKHTKVNYRIYAVCNRLHPSLKAKLIAQKDIQICNIPTTSLRGSQENRYYLSRLYDIALEDGCTHIANFHIDSFPVIDGWDDEIIKGLSPACPVASVMMSENEDYKPHTSFLMFTADFYQKYRPGLLLTDKDIESPEYLVYSSINKHQKDSGSGFGFLLYREGLDWIQLERTNNHSDHFHMAGIYGGMIFHLSGAVRDSKTFNRSLDTFWQSKGSGYKKILNALISKTIPQGLLYKLKQKLSKYIFFRQEHTLNLKKQKEIMSRLFEDPQIYIDYLMKGG